MIIVFSYGSIEKYVIDESLRNLREIILKLYEYHNCKNIFSPQFDSGFTICE